MYAVNDSSVPYRFSSSAIFGGYSAEICSSKDFGYCYSPNALSEVYASNLIAPATWVPGSQYGGETQACCVLAEWTGVTDTNGNGLTQGGVGWSGYNMPPPSDAINGFYLFIEAPGHEPIPIQPPSWMNGVQGQIITMYTLITGNCALPNGGGGGDIWTQTWQMGSHSTSQAIACIPLSVFYMGWSILESPSTEYEGSACSNGGFPWVDGNNNLWYACELPQFSNIDPGLQFTGVICNLTPSCFNFNYNNCADTGYYIVHNQQDTTTSGIPGGGDSWYEQWVSSA